MKCDWFNMTMQMSFWVSDFWSRSITRINHWGFFWGGEGWGCDFFLYPFSFFFNPRVSSYWNPSCMRYICRVSVAPLWNHTSGANLGCIIASLWLKKPQMTSQMTLQIYKSISILIVSRNSLFIYTYIMSVMVVARPSFGASMQT